MFINLYKYVNTYINLHMISIYSAMCVAPIDKKNDYTVLQVNAISFMSHFQQCKHSNAADH